MNSKLANRQVVTANHFNVTGQGHRISACEFQEGGDVNEGAGRGLCWWSLVDFY